MVDDVEATAIEVLMQCDAKISCGKVGSDAQRSYSDQGVDEREDWKEEDLEVGESRGRSGEEVEGTWMKAH